MLQRTLDDLAVLIGERVLDGGGSSELHEFVSGLDPGLVVGVESEHLGQLRNRVLSEEQRVGVDDPGTNGFSRLLKFDDSRES